LRLRRCADNSDVSTKLRSKYLENCEDEDDAAASRVDSGRRSNAKETLERPHANREGFEGAEADYSRTSYESVAARDRLRPSALILRDSARADNRLNARSISNASRVLCSRALRISPKPISASLITSGTFGMLAALAAACANSSNSVMFFPHKI
jgi:hypothetical protein